MKKGTITYYFDSLCGWCFGFTDVMDQLFQKYEHEIEFEVVSGGLFVGERVGRINDIAPYVKAGAYLSVEERTGVKFGKQFLVNGLQKNEIEMNSLFPAIALSIVKDLSPSHAMRYASTLLKAIYIDGMSTDYLAMYGEYAEKVGANISNFERKMKIEKYRLKAREDFSTATTQGVRGFPTLIFTVQGNSIPLSSGYSEFDVIDEKIQLLLRSRNSVAAR